MNRLILVVIALFFTSVVFAEGKIILNNEHKTENFDLTANLFYLIDAYSEYDFAEVLSKEFANKFTQAVESEFYFSSNAKTQWYKLQIDNQSDDFQELILSINNPLVQKITIFSSTDSSFFTTGALFPYKQRQTQNKNFVYQIKLKPDQIGTFCVRIDNQKESLFVPFSLNYSDVYYNKLDKHQFFNGIFYVLIVLTLLLLIVLWHTEKERIYIYFFVLTIVLVLYQLWRDTIIYSTLLANMPKFNLVLGKVLLSLVFVAILVFGNRLLYFAKSKTLLRKSLIATVYLLVIFTLIQFFVVSQRLYFVLINIFSGAIITLIIIGILANAKKKIQYFKRFAFLMLVLLVYVLFIGILGYHVKGLGVYDLQITKLVIFVFFGVSTSLFVNKFIHSRSEVYDLSKNLESLVDKRTVQLNAQKEELKSQHEELLLQKETLQSQREELRAQKELLEIKNQELEKLSLVASKTDNLIYIFKPNGDLDWFNSSYSLVYGKTFEEYKREDVPVNIVDLSRNRNIRHVLNTCLREKTVVSYDSVLESENGDSTWYHTTLTPILNRNDEVRLLIAIDTNITKLKHYESELNQQRKDAEQQKNLAIQRKEELEERQIEITDSIRYAKRIQTAIMPKVKQIQRDFPESFVLFLPKDIVSGDFYWYHRIGDKYFIAAVDCTGHGVPGAFMSIIGNYLLNSIIIHNQISDPAEILKQLNRKIKIAMKTDVRAQTTDGMDISVCVIDKNEHIIEYAGAIRPMYLFNQGDFIEVKGDKIPITSSISGVTLSTFKTKQFSIQEGDIFYLFSDGIIDQFGGTKGKKFLTKRFKQLLFDINTLPMPEQKELIKKAFDEWKGDGEQVDDILVMGVKF